MQQFLNAKQFWTACELLITITSQLIFTLLRNSWAEHIWKMAPLSCKFMGCWKVAGVRTCRTTDPICVGNRLVICRHPCTVMDGFNCNLLRVLKFDNFSIVNYMIHNKLLFHDPIIFDCLCNLIYISMIAFTLDNVTVIQIRTRPGALIICSWRSCNIWGCVFSAYPFLLRWLWEKE